MKSSIRALMCVILMTCFAVQITCWSLGRNSMEKYDPRLSPFQDQDLDVDLDGTEFEDLGDLGVEFHPLENFRKRAAFGLLGLATKRPQRTEASLLYPPAPEAFIAVKGRKKRSALDGGGRGWAWRAKDKSQLSPQSF